VSDVPPPWSAVADIGQLGIETAAAVVERLLSLTSEVGRTRLPLLPATPDGAEARQLRADAERLIDLYAEWTRTLVDAAVDLATPSNGTNGRDALVLGPVGQGRPVEGTVWLHVLDGPAADHATLRSTNLSAHHGGQIGAEAVSFDPPTVEVSAPRTTLDVRIRVTVPSGTPSGPYHGHVLVDGLPEVCLGLRVDVTGPP
jgi:hypothetical protein